MTATPRKRKPASTKNMLVLHIELAEVQPTVWREVVVPDSITLPKLHSVIQLVMGWQGGHLHEFQMALGSYGNADPDFAPEVQSEQRVSLKKALGASGGFVYLYDFGDGWQHYVKVNQTLPLDPGLKLPLCIGGEQACPPEDVGGPWGYEAFLAAISDPGHEDHDTMLEWCGEAFDPTHFDLAMVDALLASMTV
jgi:hypothetical protein